jgi:hypothetical protein
VPDALALRSNFHAMTHGPRWHLDRWASQRLMRGAVAQIQTIPVYCEQVPEGERLDAMDRVAKALDLIHRFDRRRTDRLERDRIGIVLAPGFGQHSYSEATNTIHLDLRLVTERPTAAVASSIVHELTHARFALAGVYYSRRCALRMERRCVEEEIAFVGRLPYTKDADYTTWVDQRRARLARPWWTWRGRLRAVVQTLEAEAAPQWIIRLTRFLSR